MTAEMLMMVGGVSAFLLTLHWVRRRDLREKYAVGWLVVALLLLVLGIFPDLIKSFADAAHLSYPAAVLFVVLGAIYIFSFFVSVSLTRQYRRNVRLAQELAILEERLRRLENARAVGTESGPAPEAGPQNAPSGVSSVIPAGTSAETEPAPEASRQNTPSGVSLVIPAKNAAGVLSRCLEAVAALLGKDGLDEIILVDDGSTDDTAAIAERYPVTVLRCPAMGPGGARNVGWKAAKNPLVWFIDSDCVAEPDALKILLPYLQESLVGGAGGSYGNMRPDSTLACLIHEEIIERHRTMPTEVDYLATFNVLYRRDALEKVGGFDEGNVNGPGAPGAEDIDLAYRLHDAGYRLRFDRRSLVGHFHPTRLWRYLRSQRLHGYFRVWLYLHHRGRVGGDAYSGLVDHLQPPVAMLALGSLPLAFWPPLYLVPLGLAALLLLLQLPMTVRLLGRLHRPKYLLFASMSVLRAFWRGIGMSHATLKFVFRFGRKSSLTTGPRPAVGSNPR